MTRLEFVKSQWEKLSEGYLKKRTGLSIEGPHVVISEIVFDEENWNEYSAKRYDFFKRLLCRYLKAPLIDYIPRSGEYRQLIQALNRKDRNAINSHSRSLKAAFDNGEYFTLLSSYIRDFLESEAPSFNNIARPKAVIKQLYVELVLRGYEVDEIKELFSNIVSPCEVTDGGKLKTRFPVYLIPNRWDMSVQEVSDFINRLSFPGRLLYLDRHFFADSVAGFCAFHVTGLAISSRVEIGDVLFLPPGQKSVDFNGVELDLKHLRFVEYEKPEIYPVCVVRTKGATGKQAAREAISKFEIVHRTILLYFRTKMRIKAESTSWAFYNSEGAYRTNKYSSKIQDQQFNALSLTSEKLAYIEDGMLPVVGSISDTDTFNSALYWYGRAIAAEDSAEQLLFYWISIECLFNGDGIDKDTITGGTSSEKIELILAVISAAMLLSELHDQIWDIYYYFFERAYWFQESSGIPEDLLQQFKGIAEGNSFFVWDFMAMLPRLIQSERDPTLRSEFQASSNSFADARDHEKLVNRIVEQLATEVQLLYRFRNLIVHSAFKDEVLLPYFTWLAGTYAGVLLRSIRSDLKKGLNIGQSINRMSTTVDRYKRELSQGKIPCLDDDFLKAL